MSKKPFVSISGASVVARLSVFICLVACGSEPGNSTTTESNTGGKSSTVPGNEAIVEIGRLPIGGTTNAIVSSTDVAYGGNTTSTTSVNVGGTANTGTSSGGSHIEPRGGSGGANTTSGATSTMVGGQSSTESSYHDLSNWVTPEAKNLNHHGRVYFLAKAQKDEHGVSCTACHGSELEGTTSAPSCNSCHSNWRNCSSCHGTNGTQSSPPSGVGDETSIATLAVGRHTAHLTNGTSHSAFACNTCHVVPAANDITHTLGYEESNDLSTSGHHGDIVFSTLASTMTWNVNGTTGTPISARGTCTGACHSNGRGGPPAKTPYWAGGTWTNGCTNCHGAPPNSGKHSDHRNYACSECHAGATATSYTSSNHFNGKRDYSSSKMPYKNGQCSGSCHENETW